MYYQLIMLLCLALLTRICVVLTQQELLCVDDPDCFTLLIKQLDALNQTISDQLAVHKIQLRVQQEQLNAIRDLQSRNSIPHQLGLSVLTNLVYIITLGVSAVVVPWVYKKLAAHRKTMKKNSVDRELAETIIFSALSHVHGSGLVTTEQRTDTAPEALSLAKKMGNSYLTISERTLGADSGGECSTRPFVV